jgi:hypothetical protein
MKKAIVKISLMYFLICSQYMKAQLIITDSLDFSSISTLLQGFGTNISNTVYNCDSAAVAQFTGVSELPNTNGLLLSTGRADSIANSAIHFASYSMLNGITNDVDMNTLAGFLPTYDGCILEFDCVPLGDTLLFNYTFASEEYPEFVGMGFNDAFGIFLTGPGYTNVNIASIPGTSTPVTVNNVNASTNATYYQDNSQGQFCAFDGFTISLTSTTAVTPNQTYHFKIGVADASDQIFDTGVFLEAFSFRSNLSASTNASDANQISLINDEVNERVLFRFKNPTGTNTIFQMYDINGRCIAVEKLSSGVLSHSLSVSDLSAGIYFVRISGEAEADTTFRFLVH